ncbi:polyprenyl synthetase family protein [Actinocorallia longicatena]|uniref:Family 2 encapsulin nanocompartment cargo protein polyprenyl transferase n=1 Tax=Actinocorallia longicatena TaxID=111803 RepID=A0ABP6QRK9_9ACTN
MTTVHERARPAAEVLEWGRATVDPAMREAVGALPDPVRHIAGYHFGWWDATGQPSEPTGKALRPTLTLLACQAVGGDVEAAVPAAVAVELVHDFSLLHDDVMDGDRTRRHRPTAWTVFGTGPAILTGDVLLTLAVELVAAAGPHARILTSAVLDLLGGQNADTSFEQRDDVTLSECVAMAVGKTGALLRVSCTLGALAGGATPDQVARLGLFGEHLGLAFQHVDDLLGIWGDPAATGKPVHSDLLNRKKSLPVVAALTSGTPAGDELASFYFAQPEFDPARAAALVEQAGGRDWSRERAAQLLRQALDTLNVAAPDTTATGELTALARMAVDRTH